ncbi:Serine/threonine-protein kinase STY46 [Pelomyxa schiedti]|nr:Serine/threonine-protein kinase STY46 [Pelomyxa schiedti]
MAHDRSSAALTALTGTPRRSPSPQRPPRNHFTSDDSFLAARGLLADSTSSSCASLAPSAAAATDEAQLTPFQRALRKHVELTGADPAKLPPRARNSMRFSIANSTASMHSVVVVAAKGPASAQERGRRRTLSPPPSSTATTTATNPNDRGGASSTAASSSSSVLLSTSLPPSADTSKIFVRKHSASPVCCRVAPPMMPAAVSEKPADVPLPPKKLCSAATVAASVDSSTTSVMTASPVTTGVSQKREDSAKTGTEPVEPQSTEPASPGQSSDSSPRTPSESRYHRSHHHKNKRSVSPERQRHRHSIDTETSTDAQKEAPPGNGVGETAHSTPTSVPDTAKFQSVFKNPESSFSWRDHSRLQVQLSQLIEMKGPVFQETLEKFEKMDKIREEMEDLELKNAENNLRQLDDVIAAALAGTKSYHKELSPTDFTLGDMVGRGAAGKVYKGVWNNQTVAIKHYSEDNMAFDIKDFKKELTLMSVFDHENLISCIGACTKDFNHLYIVTELMPFSLGSYVEKNEIDLKVCLHFASGIAKGLAYLHSYHVIHRDVKPANVLLTASLEVKIIDFGNSRVVNNTGALTANLGTVQYMAPELFENKGYTEKIDIYALGILMWEMSARQQPYIDKPSWAIPVAVSKGDRPTLPKSISASFAKLIKACWHGVPAKRPTILEVRECLRKIDLEEAQLHAMLLRPACGNWETGQGVTDEGTTTDVNSEAAPKWLVPSEVLSFDLSASAFPIATPVTHSFDIFNNTDTQLKYSFENYDDGNLSISLNKTKGNIKPKARKALEVSVTLVSKTNTALRIPLLIAGDKQFIDFIIRSDAGLFGVDPMSLNREIDSGLKVPAVLILFKKALIHNQGLETPNIFMQPGDPAEVKRLQELANRGQFVATMQQSPHDIAQLIKVWFRNLPTGLLNEIPPEVLDSIDSLEQCLQTIRKLSYFNQVVLEWLMRMLTTVAKKQAVNKMTPQLLAFAIAPNLFHARDLEAKRHLQATTDLLHMMIGWFVDPSFLFKRDTVSMSSAAAAASASSSSSSSSTTSSTSTSTASPSGTSASSTSAPTSATTTTTDGSSVIPDDIAATGVLIGSLLSTQASGLPPPPPVKSTLPLVLQPVDTTNDKP